MGTLTKAKKKINKVLTNHEQLMSQIGLIENLLISFHKEKDQIKRDKIENEIYRIRRSITNIEKMTRTEKEMKCRFLVMTVESQINL